jgi:RES domain-containing protein
MAESVSLAVLENLVHMSRADFPNGYVVAGAVIPDHVSIMTESALKAAFGVMEARYLGDAWLESNHSAVLAVRSVVVPSEHNFLLNPRHLEFKDVVVEIPTPFEFDPLLFRKDR